MTATIRNRAEHAIDVLRGGDCVLGEAEQDYALADLLEILVALHDATGICLEFIPQVGGLIDTLNLDESALDQLVCRECGCTEEAACEGGCWWVAEDLCSACASKAAAS